MDQNEKNDPNNFPRSYRAPMQPHNHSLANRFLHVIVPKEKAEDSKCDSCSDYYIAQVRSRCAGSFFQAGKARLRNSDKKYRRLANNWSSKLKKHEPFKASFQMYCKFCAQNDKLLLSCWFIKIIATVYTFTYCK
jgi:hypothetical protein